MAPPLSSVSGSHWARPSHLRNLLREPKLPPASPKPLLALPLQNCFERFCHNFLYRFPRFVHYIVLYPQTETLCTRRYYRVSQFCRACFSHKVEQTTSSPQRSFIPPFTRAQ